MTETDDNPLVARVRRGDVAALGQFIDERRHALTAYIQRKLGPALRRKIEPEDVLQEVSVSAVAALKRVDLTGHDPFGWLCQLADRRIVDAHRHFASQKRAADREVALDAQQQTSRAQLINMLVVSMTTPSQQLSRQGRELRLHAALAKLPDEQRELLRMRYVEGLPTKEIAERVGKGDGAVRVTLSRAVRRLQELLEGPVAG